MEPILLFLDIDGVLSVSDTDVVDQKIRLDGSLVYPLPGAKEFLQVVARTPWIQPLWISSWGTSSRCWNNWAATADWNHAHPLPPSQRQSAQTQFQAHDPEAKYLSARWHSRDWQQSINTGSLAESINTTLNAGVYYLRMFLGQSPSEAERQFTFAVEGSSNTSTEIAWRHYGHGDNILWTMDGTSVASLTYLQNIAASTQWRIQATGDFNNDGSTDLVWRNAASGENLVWLMNGVSYSTSIYLNPVADTNWQIQGAGDFNDDGKTDLLWRNYANGQNLVWFMNGTTSLSLTFLDTVADPKWQIQAVGDFNKDGQSDIVWRYQAAVGSSSTGTNTIWLMNGTSRTASVALQPVNDFNWQIQGTGDFNKDGKTDLLWRNYANGENIAWFMNGTTYSTFTYLLTVNDPNWHIGDATVQYLAPTPIDGVGETGTAVFDIGVLNGSGAYSDLISSASQDRYVFAVGSRSHVNLSLSGLSTGSLRLNTTVGTDAGNGIKTISADLNPGSYSIFISQTDSSPTWYRLNIVAEALAPGLSAGLASDTAGGSGTTTDGITADPTITGQISVGQAIQSLRAWFGGTNPEAATNITAALQLGGSFSLAPTLLQQVFGGTLTQGFHTLHLQALNRYGKSGTINVDFTLDSLVVAPTGLALVATSDKGQSSSDGVTSVTMPTVTGTAEAGSLVKLYRGSQLIGQATATTGTWEIMTSQLAQGTHAITAIATDKAGNVSAASQPLSLVIDTVLPQMTLTSPIDTAPLTQQSRLVGTVNGTGSAMASLTYRFGNGSEIALAFNSVTGAFDQAIDLMGVSGTTQTLTMTATDAAGNATSTPFNITVVSGDAPVIVAGLIQDTGVDSNDRRTSDPTISGRVTDVDPVTVFRAGFDATLPANFMDVLPLRQSDGRFTLNRAQLETIYGGPLSEGLHTLHLQAGDQYGNVSPVFDTSFTLDTIAPGVPGNLSLTPAGMYAVAISGSAEAGATVQLFEGSEVVGEAIANTTGVWRLTTSQLRNGSHSLTAVAIDAAGNPSLATTPTLVTVSTLVPTAPQEVRLTAATDSGHQSDNITNDSTPTVTGTAEAGATVRLFHHQQLLGEVIANSTTGAWSIELATALPQGEQVLSVIAHNANGDSQATTLAVTIDAVAPLAQLNTLAVGSSNAVALANNATLTTGMRLVGTVDGTASAVASLQYQLGTGPAVTIPVAANGLFNHRLDLTGISGAQTLMVTMTDVAGNTTTLAPYTVTVDSTSNGGTTGGGVDMPVLLAQLTQDTGSDTADGWTYVPGVAGVVSAVGQITALRATFDPASTANFLDLTDVLDAGGTFELDLEQLAALAGGELADGEYGLRLQVQTDTNQTVEKLLTFKLDRTAPTQSLPNLIDGIAWERGMRLQGTVQDSSTVQVAYQIEQVSSGQAISQHSFVVAGSSTGTTFDQVMAELAAGNSTLQEEEPYNLILTSTDVAGNSQRSRFQFFVPSARKVTDDDALRYQPPSSDSVPQNPQRGDVRSWGSVGSGGGWGYWDSSLNGGSGGFAATPVAAGAPPFEFETPPEPLTAPLSGSGYEYVESIREMVEGAVDLISVSPATLNKKAALDHREYLLAQLGERLNKLIHIDGDFYNDRALVERMRPVMQGLFAYAYDPRDKGTHDGRPIDRAGVEESFVPLGAGWLAQSVVKDPLSVRVQVFQATLLEVVTESTLEITDVNQQRALALAVMDLAKTYAWLNPNPEATVPAADKDYGFLDALWRLQIPNPTTGIFDQNVTYTLETSVAALERLLEGVEDKARAIQFLNNLVQAASNVTSLKADVKEAQFLRELVEFGVEFVKTNPTVNPMATDAAVQGFLDRMWRGDTQQVKQAEGGLNAFFAGMETEVEKIKGLEFAGKLIDAADLLQGEGLQPQKHDAVFLDALVELGGVYAALNPQPSVGVEDPQLFLNTLWQGQSVQTIQTGATQMPEFFTGFDTRDEQLYLLSSERKILEANLQVTKTSKLPFDSQALSSIIESGKSYTSESLTTLDPFPNIYASAGNLYVDNQVKAGFGIEQLDFSSAAVAALTGALIDAYSEESSLPTLFSGFLLSVPDVEPSMIATVNSVALNYSALTFDKVDTWSAEERRKELNQLVNLIKNSDDSVNMANFLNILFQGLNDNYDNKISQGLATLKPEALIELLNSVPAALKSLLNFAQNRDKLTTLFNAIPYSPDTSNFAAIGSLTGSIWGLFGLLPSTTLLARNINSKVLTFVELLAKVPKNHIFDDLKDPTIRDYASESIPLLLIEAKRQGVQDPAQVAYILASVQKESGFGGTMIEYKNHPIGGRDQEIFLVNPAARDNPNTPEVEGYTTTQYQREYDDFESEYGLNGRNQQAGNNSVGDGFKYRGMGYIQLTGHSNYDAFGVNPLGKNTPNSILQPEVSARVAVKGMKEGKFAGSGGLSSYITSNSETRKEDLFVSGDLSTPFIRARRIVNGGQVNGYFSEPKYKEAVDEIAQNALKYWELLRQQKFD